MINFKQTLDIVKKTTTLQRVIESYGISVDNPNKFIKCCFHFGDKTASLKLYNGDTGEGSFYCFGCRRHGDLLSFAQLYENKTPGEALASLCRKLGIKIEESQESLGNSLVDSIKNVLNPPKKEVDALDIMKCALEARKEFEELKDINLTRYMIGKQVNHYGTKSKGNLLVVPAEDEFGRIWNLQYINANGAKFYRGGVLKGLMHRIGEDGTKFAFLSEGYSTSVSVHESTGNTVYVCFSAGNIKEVQQCLLGLYPAMKLVLAGDNDEIGRGTGVFPAVFPPDPYKDWNDLYVKEGPDKTRKELLKGGIGENC
jgi:phage/plasmid primase-like uncharacterized protein